jgi:phosphatidylinositol phospholipase C beta
LDQAGLPSGKTDEINRNTFQFLNFKEFYLKLVQRREVKTIFDGIANPDKSEPNKNVIRVKEFLDFLNNEQRDPRLNEVLHPYATEEKALNIINRYEPNSHLASLGELSFDGFLWYLLSDENNVISQDKLEKDEDMDQSLAHYFINSSHNTYLTGHQITGRASREMYRQVLLSGCRCIELDFWNGQKEDDEPHITHGYTLVTKLAAKKVLETIATYAFKTSDYPLILSFENHCNPKQQAKIAKYCEEYFGDLMLQVNHFLSLVTYKYGAKQKDYF